MAKGPEITDEIRLLATKLHKEHPKWTNKEIRNWILKSVHEDDPSLPKEWPSKFAIDRIMPGIRERIRKSKLEPSPLDKPWSVLTMIQYPIPPEALPSVLRVWYLAKDWGYALTIREAQWVARVYAVTENRFALMAYSNERACFEQECEDAGVEAEARPGRLSLPDLVLYRIMTGDKMSREEIKKSTKWRAMYAGLEPGFYLGLTIDEREQFKSGSEGIKSDPRTQLSLMWEEATEAVRQNEQQRKRQRKGGTT